MSENKNNFDEKEVLEDETITKEVMEDEVEVVDDGINGSVNQEDSEAGENGESNSSFLKNFMAAIVDVAVIGVISTALLYILEAILKLTGYYISQKVSMLFIIFVVISVLYISIMQTIKKHKTLGEIFLNL